MSLPFEQHPFLVIGHRGARGHAPENTLLALDTGIRLGADMLEFDVQRHGDELVLMHDLRLERTTNGGGRLCEMHFTDLRRLDAGQGQQIPTLDEALDLIADRVPLNIEIKSANGTADLLADRLRERLVNGADADDFLVSSFHLPELYEFKQALPQIPIGLLHYGVPLDWAASASELQAVSIHLAADFVDERLLADAQSRGLKVLVYTVNEAQEIVALRALGVHGVFSDHPDIARSVAGSS